MTTARNAGFTLVELLATVTIVGILSMVATVSYRRLTLSAKMAEATHMVQAIRTAQESYRAETGTYLDLSTSLAMNDATNLSSCYPPSTPSTGQVGWNPADVPCGSRCKSSLEWTALNVSTDGAVRFCYTTVAGAAGVAAPSTTMKQNGANVAWGDVNRGPWYVVAALGDLNGNGVYSTVLTSSWSSLVVVDADGE